MMPALNVQLVRGTGSFANACRLAATTLALVACANASATVDTQPSELESTAAARKVATLLPDQRPQAKPISPEQSQTLDYGVFPPVKTTILVNGKMETYWTLHPFDLVRLARTAAQKATAIEGIKVDSAKVGALMLTESALVARTGWSANGKTPSEGLGQLEPNTAKALGVANPNNPEEAALAVARLLAQSIRFSHANRHVDQNIAISLAYNTSTSLRKALVAQYGSELSMADLPVATQAHVKNMIYSTQRMVIFEKLSDQHARQLKENMLNTSHTPMPTTKMLVTDTITDGANQARLTLNQEALEKDGHVQVLPMTAKGLSAMRMAIADHVQRLGQSDNLTSLQSAAAAPLPTALTGTGATTLPALTQSLLAAVRTKFEEIRTTLFAAAKAQTGGPAKPVLLAARNSTGVFIQSAQQLLQQVRDRIEAEQVRPT